MSQTTIPRAAVRGTAAGVIFMAFFGTLWAGIGIRGMQGWGFLVLIILFQVPTYYITGTFLCLLPTLVMLTFPVKTIISDHHIMVWWVSVGFGSALILWGTGIIVCVRGFRLLSMAKNVADNGKWR